MINEIDMDQRKDDFTQGYPDEQLHDDHTEQLKTYLMRLNKGEDLETIRRDFVKKFSDVEASEIMQAEQELLRDGTPLSEVQKLCDVHSALFHGATLQEKIAKAEHAVKESAARRAAAEKLIRQNSSQGNNYTEKKARAAALSAVKGHPLYTFTKENEAFAALIDEYLTSGDKALFDKIREIAIHYAKKGDLLYPLLKVKYGITGPADVMWTVDDEIRDELRALAKDNKDEEDWDDRAGAVLKRAKEMIFKEQNILFPICAVNFSDEEWHGIYRDSRDYAACFGVRNERWQEAEERPAEEVIPSDDEVVMPGGHMTVRQLTALLDTIPLEISFIDADDINRFFNEGPKVFKRPHMAVGRDVFSCHPPKIEPMVHAIIDDFRSGKQDSVPVWMEKNGRTMLVTYMAVRDKDKKYLGTVEIVQDMEPAKAHFCNA
jgi:DUF438 domain-containing protein